MQTHKQVERDSIMQLPNTVAKQLLFDCDDVLTCLVKNRNGPWTTITFWSSAAVNLVIKLS